MAYLYASSGHGACVRLSHPHAPSQPHSQPLRDARYLAVNAKR